ncbi:Alpha/Beta hydrolase protein [Schizothecium vesticola]|uniref:Carboxylic ester hydrolase n=1 Tax=Schizothecium vesticola TaxID=314040 RepID=A0AA40BP77_9PEZI|nr:Alpha/Beta hydrolase protein [Schizothecium vesticola]
MKGSFSVLAAGSLALFSRVSAAPPQPPASQIVERGAAPTVTISTGTIVGASRLATEAFNGIPYAVPPTGDRRLRPPVRLTSSVGTYDAAVIPNACPQFLASTEASDLLGKVLDSVTGTPLFQKALKVSEDCLTVNVVRPVGTKAGQKLPVLFWIFGGGFQLGWTSMYDAGPLLTASIMAGKPYVFVAVNYRVGGFGFMPGKEILRDGAANLGLLDQRMGLEWVADNIDAFGGDPEKVTLWGESAGAISVLDQMALYDGDNMYKGKPLFRGAIMNSGSITPTDPVDCPKGQVVYDAVVKKAGCASSPDTLACLRALPYPQFLDAANSVPAILSYNSVALSYLPRPDGKLLTLSPDLLVKQGKYAAVPMIIADQEDEGTLFSLFQGNITSTPKLVSYLSTIFFHGATTSQLTDLVRTYDAALWEGSPFRTGLLNEVYPGFKRLAAILGDLVFTLSRRLFLADALKANPNVPAWSYLASYNYGLPILGTFHGSDLLQVFYGILPNHASKSIQSFYSNFVYNLDPNDSTGGTNAVGTKVEIAWPQWGGKRELMQFFNDRAALLKDDFRAESYEWIERNIAVLNV